MAKPSKVPIWLIFQILAPGKGPDASRKVDDGKGGSWVSPEAASGAPEPKGGVRIEKMRQIGIFGGLAMPPSGQGVVAGD